MLFRSTPFCKDLSVDTRDHDACSTGHSFPCSHVYDFLGAVFFPAQYFESGRGCGVDDDYSDSVHVDVPYHYGICFQLCVPFGIDGDMDCHDHRLDFPGDLLYAALPRRQVGDHYAQAGGGREIEGASCNTDGLIVYFMGRARC